MYGRGNKRKDSYLGTTVHGSGNENEEQTNYLGVGIALGVTIGAVLGTALNNLALGIGLGIALSVSITLALSNRRSGKTGTSGRDAKRGGDTNGDAA